MFALGSSVGSLILILTSVQMEQPSCHLAEQSADSMPVTLLSSGIFVYVRVSLKTRSLHRGYWYRSYDLAGAIASD